MTSHGVVRELYWFRVWHRKRQASEPTIWADRVPLVAGRRSTPPEVEERVRVLMVKMGYLKSESESFWLEWLDGVPA